MGRDNMGYPTPPLSSGVHSPKVSSLPPYASQLTRTSTTYGHGHDQSHEKQPYFPPYEADTRTYQGPASPTYTKPYYPSSPNHAYRSPRSRTGSPIMYRIPSPYNASRPKPRKGFVKRVLGKFREWLRDIMRFARRNPIKMGLISFLPVLALGGLVKGLVSAGRGLMKLVGENGKKGKKEKKDSSGAESGSPDDFGIFDHFSKFGGSKAGPLDGILKIIQMLVNHYCKLTPSHIPRTASILLELYFLERKL